MGRCYGTVAVAIGVAALMSQQCVRTAVAAPVSALVGAFTANTQMSVGIFVAVLLAYALLHYRALAVPLIDVPLSDDEANPVKPAPAGIPAGVIRHESRPGKILCWDPSTNDFLGEAVAMDAAAVTACVDRARAAQVAWAQTTFSQRRRVMRMLNKAILARQDDICRLSTRDSGKTRMDALLGEIMTTCEKIAWINREGEAALATSYRKTNLMMMHKSARVEYVPVGVLGVIAPWNYPFHNMLNHIISGLFAGNAVVSKASEYTSWCGTYYLRLVREVLAAAGHDPELVQLVTGFADAGAALVGSSVDKIIFTGSPGIGRHVMLGCAKVLKPVVLELGGKDPVIVCEDADFEQVINYTMRGVFGNAGQNCIGIERMYVYEGVYDKFVQRITANMKSFRQGLPLGDDYVDAGAMTMPAQIQIVDDLVQDAVAKGATLLCGGKRNPNLPGTFYEPTVLLGVTHDMRIANEEVFGPVMSVFKVTGGDQQCIAMVNSTEYGLGSSIFTRDLARGERLQRAVRAGMTCINDFGTNYMAQSLPFGGVGISGFGRFGGAEGLQACCHMKSIITDIVPGIRTQIPGVIQYPLNAGSVKFTKGLLNMMYGASPLDNLRGIMGLITARRTAAPASAQDKKQA